MLEEACPKGNLLGGDVAVTTPGTSPPWFLLDLLRNRVEQEVVEQSVRDAQCLFAMMSLWNPQRFRDYASYNTSCFDGFLTSILLPV